MLSDNVTTDHISPVSQIRMESSAGGYLTAQCVEVGQLGSFMARRVNHEVMLRGTFANPRLVNELVPGLEGGMTRHMPGGSAMTIDLAAKRYAKDRIPLIVIAGGDYGAGSSRDWAAKGARLLGISVITAHSFERIHRSHLVEMGILPLQLYPGETRQSLGLTGSERFDFLGIDRLQPRQTFETVIHRAGGRTQTIALLCRIDAARELAWYRHGGIMPFALRSLGGAN